MSQRHTLIRSLHDVGLAAWFGGSLMGAVGLNGATAEAKDPRERLALSSLGWKRWAPVQLAAIIVHGIGGVGLIVTNVGRLSAQSDARSNAVVKITFTALAGAVSLWAGIEGAKMGAHSEEGAVGTTEPSAGASDTLASAQRRQRLLQWAIPATTLVLIVLNAQQGEQQRPVAGWVESLRRRSS